MASLQRMKRNQGRPPLKFDMLSVVLDKIKAQAGDGDDDDADDDDNEVAIVEATPKPIRQIDISSDEGDGDGAAVVAQDLVLDDAFFALFSAILPSPAKTPAKTPPLPSPAKTPAKKKHLRLWENNSPAKSKIGKKQLKSLVAPRVLENGAMPWKEILNNI